MLQRWEYVKVRAEKPTTRTIVKRMRKERTTKMKISTFPKLKAKHRRLWCVTMLAIVLTWVWPFLIMKYACEMVLTVIWYVGEFFVNVAKEWFGTTVGLLKVFPQTVMCCRYLADVWKGKAE